MSHPIVDEIIGDNHPKDLLLQKHIEFLAQCKQKTDCTTDYVKMSGMYWVLTALDLLDALGEVDKDEIIDVVLSCQKSDGGFSSSLKHDSHLLSTLSAIQILALFDSLDKVNVEMVCKYVAKLQQKDGSFTGDVWGEIDTRFSFCAVAILHILGMLSKDIIDVEACASYLEQCQNLDGCFGTRPGSESHAGQAYCVVGALAILRQLRRLNIDRAAWWLAERQLPSGGLNGRPEKHPDVCYSWWAVATLTILGRLTWINHSDLTRFILACQDTQTGGIADRPVNGENEENDVDSAVIALKVARNKLKSINPVLCMPQYVMDRLILNFNFFNHSLDINNLNC
ncbi:unnamed protein product [Heterobilharzia americana]|nr:unnamed protein product [Heterobilharzia americana]